MVEEVCVPRDVWLFQQADWELMADTLEECSWGSLSNMHPDQAVGLLNSEIAKAMQASIPKRTVQQKQSSHPWLNNRVKVAVSEKVAAAGTAREHQAAAACSKVIAEEREAWVWKMKKEMLSLPRGSRAWWKKEKQLQQKQTQPSGIPALRNPDKKWAMDSKSKADLLAATFKAKCCLPPHPTEKSMYDDICEVDVAWPQKDLKQMLTVDRAEHFLKSIDECSATGPDLIPARVLKKCCAALAKPLLQLALMILQWGHWPTQ